MAGVMSYAATADLVTKKVIASMELEGPLDRYPNHAHFIAADDPEHSSKAAEAFAEGHPVVLVFPGGEEVVIEPGEDEAPARVEARGANSEPLPA
jgi:hypothetical protein